MKPFCQQTGQSEDQNPDSGDGFISFISFVSFISLVWFVGFKTRGMGGKGVRFKSEGLRGWVYLLDSDVYVGAQLKLSTTWVGV